MPTMDDQSGIDPFLIPLPQSPEPSIPANGVEPLLDSERSNSKEKQDPKQEKKRSYMTLRRVDREAGKGRTDVATANNEIRSAPTVPADADPHDRDSGNEKQESSIKATTGGLKDTTFDARMIPLPTTPPGPHSAKVLPASSSPGPVAKHTIPNRRPKGWISSLTNPRILSDHEANIPPQSGVDYTQRSVSARSGPRARVSSVHAHSQGRRISGAMQYAFVSAPSQASPAAALVNENEHDSRQNEDPTSEGGGFLSMEEEQQVRYDVGIAQDQDEVWMAYVRQQLGALFPDFFSAEPTELGGAPQIVDAGSESEIDQEMGDHTGVSPGTGTDFQNLETPTRGTNNRRLDALGSSTTSTTSTEDSPLITPPPRQTILRSGLPTVPNVRDEIGGLREEIERLRSVVSGIAEGMRGVSTENPVDEVVEDETRDDASPNTNTVFIDASEVHEKLLDDQVDDELPEAFLKTAKISMSIIRALDQKINIEPRNDEVVFDGNNLSYLLNHIERLSVSPDRQEPETKKHDV
nr:uncharacterized protein CI109_006609 [Kwoniella shandongensis]KAA5525058.1 hypothetical protein CI109_006609 [Kwoniella shandongensis]